MNTTTATSTSRVAGTRQPALLDSTIGEALDTAVRRWPAREALVVSHQKVRWSYAELLERVDRLAAALLALGLEQGDRVGIWSPNNAEWVLTQFATARAGLVLVNINPAYRPAELEYALNKVGCKALVMAPAFKSSNYIDMLRSLAPELGHCAPGGLSAARLPFLRWVITIGSEAESGMLSFDDLMRQGAAAGRQGLEAAAGKLKAEDPINIQFTSGTTGAPKGATLSHRNILNNGYFVGRAIRLDCEDRLCIPVPLYHCFGMVMGNLACITHGACMVLPAESFDAGAVLDAVAAERCTALHGVPTMFIAILDHPRFGDCDLSSLRTGIMAGAPCPSTVMRKVIDSMHMREVTIAYGMTETSPVSFQSDCDDPLPLRVSTVGRVQPHVEVKVVDDRGQVVPRGASGELLVRGYSVMLGYWNDADTTAKAIDQDGWMHSGDLGAIDEDGYCRILGRIKDMVIRGGENIYPREVEDFLHGHPGIRDVQCVGVHDPYYGEELCACILPQDGADVSVEAIRDFCADHIARHKIPRYVLAMEAFPMTVTGKVQKFLLREQAEKRLGISAGSDTTA